MKGSGDTTKPHRFGRRADLRLGLCFLAFAFAAPGQAQDDRMMPIPIPAQPDAIDLGTGALPNAKATESWHRQYGSTFVRNVTVATLTPYLPDAGTSTGTAVIVAPGGGFMTLSMENEGSNVAKALAARGVAAFVLKYRLKQTPHGMPAFEQAMQDLFSSTTTRQAPKAGDVVSDLAPQLADSRAAFALVRKRAAEWHVNPDRIGMVGFSAGAMLTLATGLHDKTTKPAFIGIIYGPLAPVAVPADAPPMFVALAADDPLFGHGDFGLISSWRNAKRPVEFHLYEQGGHGFGMYEKDTTSTGWFDAFTRWMAMHGWLTPAT